MHNIQYPVNDYKEYEEIEPMEKPENGNICIGDRDRNYLA